MFPIMQFLLAIFLLIFFTLSGLRLARVRMGDAVVQFADRIIALILFFAGALAFLVVDYWIA